MSTLLTSNRGAPWTEHFTSLRPAIALFGTLPGASFGVLLSLLTFAAQVQAQTPPPPSPTPTPTAAPSPNVGSPKPVAGETVTVGTIKGRAVSNDGRPLTNATIVAQGVSGTPSIKMSPVDAEGAFVFEDLPAGLYIVLATAPGYIDESFTGADPSQLPRHLIEERLKITMIKGGVITGTITDSKGQPVVGVPVQASPPSGASSLASFMGGTTAETDDRGVYRIFGLPPGQYRVAAGGGGPFGQFTTTGFELDVLTYYPSSTRDTAVPVTVRSGDEATGIDIKYRGTEGHSISGVVLGTVEAGAAGGAVIVILSNAGTSSIQAMALASTLEQRRVFNFNGVANGEYDLFAGFQGAPTDNPLVASKRVVVRNGDLTGVELKLAVLGSITGTIVLDPIKDENKCDKRGSQVIEVVLDAPRDDAKKAGGPLMTSLFGGVGPLLNAKGEFTIKNVEPGKYRLAFKLPTDSWYVRAINPPGASVTSPVSAPGSSVSAPISPRTPTASSPGPAQVTQSELSQGVVTIKSSERVGGVTIAVAQDAAGLAGKVAQADAQAAIPEGLRVHLVPAEPDQANNVLRYSETPVNRDATFAFTNIAPGRYLIVSRIKPETAETRPRDVAWDAAPRAKLRTDAEKANTVIELKPCQAMVDYQLKFSADQ
ncbi:MAG: carboxypeptidase regulatory-like domain-containing protein [Pyrinomonadaceae bacterium]